MHVFGSACLCVYVHLSLFRVFFSSFSFAQHLIWTQPLPSHPTLSRTLIFKLWESFLRVFAALLFALCMNRRTKQRRKKTSLAGSRIWEISLEGILPDWISTQSNAPFERKKIFLHKTQKYFQHLNQFKSSKNILLYLLRMKCHSHSSCLENVSIWIGFHSLLILNRLQQAAFSHKILCFKG